jgi:hypothetical protein
MQQEQQQQQQQEDQQQPPELTTFTSLPLILQTSILAIAEAPLRTCKAAAALADDYQYLLEWFRARKLEPMAGACRCKMWTAWCTLVEAGHRATKADYTAALHYASQAGQLKTVRRILAIPLNAGASAIELAIGGTAKGGNLDVLQLLLMHANASGVRIDTPKLVPVFAKGGQLKALRSLLHRDSDPSFQDILHATAEQDWQAVLRLIQDKDRGLPPALLLKYAVEHVGSVGVQALIQLQPPSLSYQDNGSSALVAAAQQGKLRCLQLLLRHGCHPGSEGALLAAVQGGNRRCVQLLLSACKPVHIWTTDAISMAAAKGYLGILQLLLDYIQKHPAQDSRVPEVESHLYFKNWATNRTFSPDVDLPAALCIAAGRGHV